MKHFRGKYTYYQKVIAILSLFTLLLGIPYAYSIYNTSKKQVLETIKKSNDLSLQQIKYNYTVFNETMASLCMSVYLNSENQGLLYNTDVTYTESSHQMMSLKSTILNIYPSVYAISIYNGNRHEFYSTLSNSTIYPSDLSDLISDVKEIPKLQPVLRKIPYNDSENYVYVFSYYIYDFTDADNKPLSYIVLDQKANWLINNFTKAKKMTKDMPSRLYLVNRDNTICAGSEDDVPNADKKLLDQNHTSSDKSGDNSVSSYYTDNISGERFLLTRLNLNSSGDSLVMIQDYNDVFADFVSLRITFRNIILIWIALYVLAICLASRSLYHPVRTLLKSINDLSGKTIVKSNSNEFNQIMELYKDSHKKLAQQTNANQYFMQRYQLEKLLTDDALGVWDNFCASCPGHWLVTEDEYTLRTLSLSLNPRLEDGSVIPDDDFNLFLFITQNILSELMAKEYKSEIFQASDNTVSGIIQASEGNFDLILEGILKETQEYLKKYVSATFSAAYSEVTHSPSELSRLFRDATQLLNYNFVYGTDAIISTQTCASNLFNESNMYPETLEKKLISSIKCNNMENADQLIEEIFEFLSIMRYENIQICIMTLANHLNYTLKEIYALKSIPARIPLEQIYHKIVDSDTLDAIELHMKEYLSVSIEAFNQKNESAKKQAFVLDIQNFVNDNFSDPNLSSQSIGDYLGLTGKYVMKKFQDYTGTSLNDYIYNVRMRQAADLLQNSSLSIGKISERVGILNENYFYKLFKKAYGCTPREFSNQKKESGQP